jgi:D-alanyl-D-alanine carboxypeptidase
MFAGYGVRSILLGLFGLALCCAPAAAGPYVLIEADTGKVILENDAGKPWHPASVTKLMTTYVTFKAMRAGKINQYSLFKISPFAASTPPSKAGFPAGQTITVDNALKLLMVKSANDMAVVLAEGVGGDVDTFVAEMNASAQALGMTATKFKNPHGLPDDEQVTTARDMAILAQAIVKEFPEHEMLFRIPTLTLGKRMLRNFNRLIDRYPGADGMKTGFICASGFNLVASAHRGNKRLIAVVLGSMNAKVRAEEAAMLFERGFQSGAGLEIMLGGSKNVAAINNVAQDPANLYELMCGKDKKNRMAMSDSGDDHEDDEDGVVETPADALRALKRNKEKLLVELPPSMHPIRVYTGPARDAKGRPIKLSPDGKIELADDDQGKNKATSVRLPKIAPMPKRRPDI